MIECQPFCPPRVTVYASEEIRCWKDKIGQTLVAGEGVEAELNRVNIREFKHSFTRAGVYSWGEGGVRYPPGLNLKPGVWGNWNPRLVADAGE